MSTTDPATQAIYNNMSAGPFFEARPNHFRLKAGHWILTTAMILLCLGVHLLFIVLFLPYLILFVRRSKAWKSQEISAGRTVIKSSLLKGWTSSQPVAPQQAQQ